MSVTFAAESQVLPVNAAALAQQLSQEADRQATRGHAVVGDTGRNHVADEKTRIIPFRRWQDGQVLAWALSAAGLAQFLWLMASCARAGSANPTVVRAAAAASNAEPIAVS